MLGIVPCRVAAAKGECWSERAPGMRWTLDHDRHPYSLYEAKSRGVRFGSRFAGAGGVWKRAAWDVRMVCQEGRSTT